MRRSDCVTTSGSGSRTCCPGEKALSGSPPRTIGCSSRRCSTAIVPGFHGAICRSGSVRGQRSSSVQPLGQRRCLGTDVSASGGDADNEYAMIDSTIVRAHQHSAGAPKKTVRIRPSGAAAAD